MKWVRRNAWWLWWPALVLLAFLQSALTGSAGLGLLAGNVVLALPVIWFIRRRRRRRNVQ